MDLEMAKQLLSTCVKGELRDHAFGDVEVSWYDGEKEVASGYFSQYGRTVSVDDTTFKSFDADELRKCFASEQVERNDEAGPEEFELGKTMPGLTPEEVRQELTGRTRIKLAVYVDLDPVPGTFHSAESAQHQLRRLLLGTMSHYNPIISIESYDMSKEHGI